MEYLIFGGIALALALLPLLASRFCWIDLCDKTKIRKPSGSVLSIGDEVFNLRRHEAQLEMDRHARLPQPVPTLDGDLGIALSPKILTP